MSLPYFNSFGWEPTVLAIQPEFVEGLVDSLLGKTVPPEIGVTRTRALNSNMTRKLGLGDLGMRSLSYLRAAGDRLLSREKMDLVFFSTTVFSAMSLGPRWLRRFGVPYVLDFQDPWTSDYYDRADAGPPPGGRLKYAGAQTIAKILEPYVLRRACHMITVSPAYPKALLEKYSWLREEQFTVLPFGASAADFDCLHSLAVTQELFDPRDGYRHWVYVGRGGGDMAFAIQAFFAALQRARIKQERAFQNLRIHFIGTDYARAGRGRKTIEPLAANYGVTDLVAESTDRVPFLTALQCLLDAEALVVPGSDDPGYTASKIYPYILARKPLLAIFHEQSSVVELLERTKAGTLVTFTDGESINKVAQKIAAAWFNQEPLQTPATDWEAFRPYTAEEMTRRQCEVFDRCVKRSQEPVVEPLK